MSKQLNQWPSLINTRSTVTEINVVCITWATPSCDSGALITVKLVINTVLIFHWRSCIWSATKRVLEQWWKVPSRWGKTRAIEQLHSVTRGELRCSPRAHCRTVGVPKTKAFPAPSFPRCMSYEGNPAEGGRSRCFPAVGRPPTPRLREALCHFLMKECGSIVASQCQHDPIIAAFQDQGHKIAEVKSHTISTWWLDVRTVSLVVAELFTTKLHPNPIFFLPQTMRTSGEKI